MQNFLQTLFRYGTFWVFLFLEFICMILVVNYNQKQEKIFVSSANRIIGGVYNYYDGISDYIGLKRDIQRFQQENARLRTLIDGYNTFFFEQNQQVDTLKLSKDYRYIPARIIHKTNIGANNTFTINRGAEDGIAAHMGVIADQGIAGIVRQVSDHYAVIMSNFNSNAIISAAVRHRDTHGSLAWESLDTRYMKLKYIPNYLPVTEGDTIETSGYSTIFPKGIPIGIIEKVQETNGDHYDITVRMNSNFADLEYVYVVENLDREELNALQQTPNE